MVHGSMVPQATAEAAFRLQNKLLFGQTNCTYFVQKVHQVQSLHMKAGKTTPPSTEAENWSTGKRAVIDNIKYVS